MIPFPSFVSDKRKKEDSVFCSLRFCSFTNDDDNKIARTKRWIENKFFNVVIVKLGEKRCAQRDNQNQVKDEFGDRKIETKNHFFFLFFFSLACLSAQQYKMYHKMMFSFFSVWWWFVTRKKESQNDNRIPKKKAKFVQDHKSF